MSNVKLSASEVVKLAIAIADTADVLDGIFADGKVNLLDMGKLPALLNAVKEFASIDYMSVLPQVVDMDESEIQAVGAAFNAHLALNEKTIEASVEAGLAVILRVGQAIQVIKDVVSKIVGTTPAAA